MSRPTTHILPAGEHAILIEFDEPRAPAAFAHHLRTQNIAGIDDVVPTQYTVMVFADRTTPHQLLREIVVAQLDSHQGRDHTPQQPIREVTIGVHYNGADLASLATTCGLTPTELIELHTSLVWTCDFIGFAPAFGYLTSPDNPLDVPRHRQSRPQVPAGAVALAGPYSAVYPRSSPGGWQLIGTTAVTLWDLDSDPPSLLSAGTRVRFIDLDA